MKKIAVFPGSFDPYTIGHHDIVIRGLALFDEIVIGIGQNGSKQPLLALEERLDAIRRVYASEPRVRVVAYDGLTVDFAAAEQAGFIMRGVRSVQDFEYERSIAEANKQLSGIETVLLYTRPELGHISSTLVRDLYKQKKDISDYIP